MAAEVPARPLSTFSMMDLPMEILDMILFETFTLHSAHHVTPHKRTCYCRPFLQRLAYLLPLRLVNRAFATYFTPLAFTHIVAEGPRRATHLPRLTTAAHISPYIVSLQIALSPRDFPVDQLAAFQSASRATPHDIATMDAYFEHVEAWLTPLLAQLTGLKTLAMSLDYKGIAPEVYSANKLIPACLAALLRCVKGAGLHGLEELKLGTLYHGGYAGFFGAVPGFGLENLEKRPRSVVVKLSDGWGNFTLMPVPK